MAINRCAVRSPNGKSSSVIFSRNRLDLSVRCACVAFAKLMDDPVRTQPVKRRTGLSRISRASSRDMSVLIKPSATPISMPPSGARALQAILECGRLLRLRKVSPKACGACAVRIGAPAASLQLGDIGGDAVGSVLNPGRSHSRRPQTWRHAGMFRAFPCQRHGRSPS
jgi:hypothetical protein